jgi:sulfide:quinone oxidoreductase
MKRVLILGGGFGGLAAAHRLKARLGAEVEIVVVDRRTHFMVGFRKSWALAGLGTLEEGQRPLARLAGPGVTILHEPVTAIYPAERAAAAGGQRLEADALIVALGAELAPERVPGFSEHAYNVYDPNDIPRAAEAVRGHARGRVVLGVFGVPYKCPPAPYEMALLLADQFERQGRQVPLEVFTPQPVSMPLLDQVGCDMIDERLARRGITFLPNHKAVAVEAGRVRFANGERPYDLLLGVPPHRCPAVVAESGLTAGGEWVPVNARTMETSFPGVYAVGDTVEIKMANGKPLPKAGVFAEGMGETAAERIAAVFTGQAPQAEFAGTGGCFLEVGGGEAMQVRGSFLAQPAPEIELSEASAALLDEKTRFETERLARWFG